MKTKTDLFRELHAPGRPLLLANVWDAGSARVMEAAGAAAIATTSAGLAWAHAYPDGNALPIDTLVRAVEEIARVLSVPLTVDMEAGYSNDPRVAGENVVRVVRAGAAGINVEDGMDGADLLCAKIEAAKTAAARAGVDVFVNARTDVYLAALATGPAAIEETLKRAERYRAAGCDGVFVPGVTDSETIGVFARAIASPLNVMVGEGLAPVSELARLGVRRVSSGAAIPMLAFAVARRAAATMFNEGRYDWALEPSFAYEELNALFPS